ncbi:MAG TPA: hypothetical protein VFW64_12485 [Pseudonocardiaceae bacterium]|nr:hypothetical protein [Pseudonocardiaceae bacterium]
MTDAYIRPSIPVSLAHRPTVGGLVAPWVNVTLADGGIDFRTTHHAKWVQAWTQGVCQTCGEPLRLRPVVFLGGPNQLATYFTEPPLHSWCAAYAEQACPMVAGRLPTYADREELAHGKRGQTCPDPGCDCGGWTPHPGGSTHYGAPAHEWWAVWAHDWTLAASPEGELLGGVPTGQVKRRLVSTPPQQEATP